MNKQNTKKMHFVSQFYLKQFTDSDNNLQVLNLRWQKIKPYKTGGVLYEDYFYSLKKGQLDVFGQKLEEAFQKFETNAKDTIEKFIDNIKNNKQISESEKEAMSKVAAIFYVRTKSFREDNIDTSSQLINLLKDAISKSERDRIFFGGKDSVGMSKIELEAEERKLTAENSKHIEAMLKRIPLYTNIFFEKNWKVYIATGQERFITSDNPVMDISTGSDRILGNNILLRKQYFIVSPEILITTELREAQSKRLKRKRITGDDVNRLNARITDQATIQIISSNRDFLELAKEISQNVKSIPFNSNIRK